jgi:photosystem II stability/assembly factor-like uncharacterized protein
LCDDRIKLQNSNENIVPKNLSIKRLSVKKIFFIGICSLMLVLSKKVQAQWRIFQADKAVNMRAVHTISPTLCWIGGSQGTIFQTNNGGAKWSSFKVPGADSLDFRDIHGFSKQAAVAMSAGPAEQGKARIYRTEDGGETWNIVYQSSQIGVFLDGIDFWDKNRGICLGDPVNGKFFVLTTEDGGKTWQELPPEKRPQAEPGEACFAASGTSIIATGKSAAYIGTGGGKLARVFRSDDYGQSWNVSSTPLPAGPTSGIFGLHFWSKKHGIAVGGDYKNTADSSKNVLLTKDGGATWKFGEMTKPVGLKESVALYSKNHSTWNGDTQIRSDDMLLVAVGPNGSSSSADYGNSWQRLGKESFHAISFAGNVGYAVGAKGLIGKIDKVSGKKKRKLVFKDN